MYVHTIHTVCILVHTYQNYGESKCMLVFAPGRGGSKNSIPLSSKMVEDYYDSFGIMWLNHAYVLICMSWRWCAVGVITEVVITPPCIFL